jgi:hypothetical protein
VSDALELIVTNFFMGTAIGLRARGDGASSMVRNTMARV